MKRLALFLLVVAACKHSSASSSTSHTETSTVTDSSSSETGAVTTTTTVTEQPGETTTTTEEFGPLPAPTDEGGGDENQPDGAQQDQAAQQVAAPGVHAAKVPRHGPLVKRTVTVTRSGGEKTETVQQATQQGTAASETKAAGKQDVQAKAAEASSPSAGCIGASWLWGAAVLVGVVGVLYFALKFKRAVP